MHTQTHSGTLGHNRAHSGTLRLLGTLKHTHAHSDTLTQTSGTLRHTETPWACLGAHTRLVKLRHIQAHSHTLKHTPADQGTLGHIRNTQTH